jgi:hypothetical protein
MEAAEWLVGPRYRRFWRRYGASEIYPAKDGQEFPVIQFMLAKKGIYNLELIDSRALVRDQVYEFLFVLGQPLYRGSTQVNVNPVAIC